MNYLYKAVHPTQPNLFAAVVLASKPTNGAPPLFTIHGCYPRIIHGEVLTHRVKSRNGRSSRAVPIKTMLNEVRTNPFVPWHWGKNQKGMQAGEDHNAPVAVYNPHLAYDEENSFGRTHDLLSREQAWLVQRDQAADMAEAYMNASYHKQIPNRLLEPFSWMHTLISSTSWANFRHLRDHKDAEPHFQDWARLVKEALEWTHDNDAFQVIKPGEWHLPYITEADYDLALTAPDEDDRDPGIQMLKKISAARSARISYTPFDGDGSFEAELRRYDQLVSSDRIHASPTEHQATPDTQSTYRRQVKVHESNVDRQFDRWQTVSEGNDWNSPHLAGNFDPGWIQYRKTIPGEYVRDAA